LRTNVKRRAAEWIGTAERWGLARTGPLAGAVRRVTRRLRAQLVAGGDPLVRYRLDALDLELPLSHGLPRYRALYPLYDANIGRIAAAIARKYPRGSVVDVGANVGDTAAIIRGSCRLPILCIEGDPTFFELLERNARTIGDIVLERTLLGDPAIAFDGELNAAHGTARVVERRGATRVRFERLEDVLKRHPELASPCFVKIDTDGFDLAIIMASAGLWRQVHPAIFFEYDPALLRADEDPQCAFDLLASVGYESMLVYENTGEYVLQVRLADRAALEDLHAFYSGRGSERYADLCVFHHDDADVCEALRRTEGRLSLEARGAARDSRR
jgi:FkbM family methyltransferase